MLDRTGGADHPDRAAVLAALVRLDLDDGRFDEATAHARAALALRERVLGPDHPLTGDAVDLLGAVMATRGRPAEACPLHERAVAILTPAGGAHEASLATSLTRLGECRLALGSAALAVAAQERALALRERRGHAPRLVAATRFALARALWAAGGDRRRARALAAQAEPTAAPDERAAIATWRRRHR